MRQISLLKILFIVLIFTTSNLFAIDKLEVIPLKHRTANELIPIVSPLLGKGSTVTGQGFTLIIRAEENDIKQVRDVVARLDQAPKRLRISLRRKKSGTTSGHDLGVSGTIHSGEASIQLGRDEPAKLRIYESTRRSVGNSTQTVHALEGRQAFIQIGQLVPVPERSVDRFGNQQESIKYINASTGFYVLARITDEQVSLDVSPHSITVNKHGQQGFNIQQAKTTLRGKVGTWFSLGGIQQKQHTNSKGITYSTQGRNGLNSEIQIRVDIIAE